MTKIIMQVEDRQELREALQVALAEGEKFAHHLFSILISEWGADKYRIDQIRLIEMGTGHLINCCVKGISPMPYRDYLAARLSAYSDSDMSTMGLTREQYDRVTRKL